MAITHHEIARQAAFIAKNSADWAADFLNLPSEADKPVRDYGVQKYLAQMRERLDIIERMHSGKGKGE